MSFVLRLAIAPALLHVAVHGAIADDWPQWLGPQRDAIYRETGTLVRFKTTGPAVRWRTPIAGGFAGPAVAAGRVYVTDYSAQGDTFPLPRKRNELDGVERVLCLDATTGAVLWKHEYKCAYRIAYPAGPRATPAVADGKVYTLGAEGDLFCLDAANGEVKWSTNFKSRYKVATPIWGFCSHPLIDGDALYMVAGGEGSVAVAYDKNNGNELWRALSAAEPGYGSPVLVDAGGTRQLIIWHPEAINGLDPKTGEVYWSIPLKPESGMSIMAPRVSGRYLFAGGIGADAVLELDSHGPSATEVWRGTLKTGLYPVCAPPLLVDGVIYGSDMFGQFRAVDLLTGERLWETLELFDLKRPARYTTAFLVRHEDKFFVFADSGNLIVAKFSRHGHEELSRAKIVEPTGLGYSRRIVWSHPAFADHACFARNDKEIVCISLAAKDGAP